MKALNNHIERMNGLRKIFGQPPIQLPLNQSSVDLIAQSIDCQLSPENLSCDGELSRSETTKRAKHLHNALNDLTAYVEKNSLTMPEMYDIA